MSDRNVQEVIVCKTCITSVHIVRSAIILYTAFRNVLRDYKNLL